MRRLALGILLPLLGVVVGAAPAADSTKQAPTDAAKAAALVKQLGADEFDIRQDADKQLEKMGKSAVKALEEGVKNDDMEISSRSKRLLTLINRNEIEIALDAFLADKNTKLILKLPTYERYKKLLGDDQGARALFVEMYTTEGQLLAILERDPKAFEAAFMARVQQIQQNLYTPFGQANPLPMGQVVALLFAATDSHATTNINSFYMMTNLFYQQNIQQSFKTNTGARKLLAQYFEMRTDQNTMAQAIQLAIQMDMKEMAPTALKAALNKDTQAWTRATAVMALGKLGTKANIKDLEPLLKEETTLGQLPVGQTVVKTEMRDVALAAMIMLSGQNVQDYDFPYLKAARINPNQYMQYNFFGFCDNTQREAALKKFKESQAKEEKK